MTTCGCLAASSSSSFLLQVDDGTPLGGLRFQVGDLVECRPAPQACHWVTGRVAALWDRGYPYRVRVLDEHAAAPSSGGSSSPGGSAASEVRHRPPPVPTDQPGMMMHAGITTCQYPPCRARQELTHAWPLAVCDALPPCLTD